MTALLGNGQNEIGIGPMIRGTMKRLTLAVSALALMAGAANAATVSYTLEAKEVEITGPDGLPIKMWGYGKCSNVLDLTNIETHGGPTQDFGSATVSPDGTSVTLTNNAWKRVALPAAYNVTANTILEVTFSSTIEGEIHGVGLDTDTNIFNPIQTFQLYGTQVWGIQAHNNYPGGGAPVTYQIPVGTHYTGPMTHVTFTMDHDAQPRNGNATFSNVSLYESGTLPGGGGPLVCGPATVPGPVLRAVEGDTLEINLLNRLPTAATNLAMTEGSVPNHADAGDLDPTSLVIPGQGMAAADRVPVTFTDGKGRQRMRSLAKETNADHDPAALPTTYTFPSVRAGTYAYKSGTHQALQVQMGLYGALVVEVPAANISATPVTFSAAALSSYGTAATPDLSTATILGGGSEIMLEGSGLKKLDLTGLVPGGVSITPDTVLEFDFKSTDQGNIHAIGFDTNDAYWDPVQMFQFYGTLPWGLPAGAVYTGSTPDGWEHFVVPVGAYYTGIFTHLTLANYDGLFGTTPPPANSSFRNVVIRTGVKLAYPGVASSAYGDEQVLVYSEVDTDLHDAVASGNYGVAGGVTSTIGYHPEFTMVNGMFGGAVDVAVGASPGTLLRMLNVGNMQHVPMLVNGGDMRLIGEDGHAYPYGRPQYTADLPPGQTRDAILDVGTQVHTARLFDRANLGKSASAAASGPATAVPVSVGVLQTTNATPEVQPLYANSLRVIEFKHLKRKDHIRIRATSALMPEGSDSIMAYADPYGDGNWVRLKKLGYKDAKGWYQRIFKNPRTDGKRPVRVRVESLKTGIGYAGVVNRKP